MRHVLVGVLLVSGLSSLTGCSQLGILPRPAPQDRMAAQPHPATEADRAEAETPVRSSVASQTAHRAF